MTDQKKTENAPNAFGQNVGGKTEDPKTEGGTQSSKSTNVSDEQNKNASSDVKDSLRKTDPASLASPSQDEADKAAEGTFHKVTKDKEGVSTVVSSISEEDAKKAEKGQGAAPPFQNLRQAIDGTPGYVNLTQGGTLNSDGSKRDARSIEDINKEETEKAGPNPLVLRRGNEKTRMEQGLAGSGGVNTMFGIDAATNRMADKIGEIANKSSLTQRDKEDLRDMQKELQSTGKF